MRPARTDTAARLCACKVGLMLTPSDWWEAVGSGAELPAVGEEEQELPLMERAGRAGDASLPKQERGNAHSSTGARHTGVSGQRRQLSVTLPVPQPDGSLPDGRSGSWAGPTKKELAG